MLLNNLDKWDGSVEIGEKKFSSIQEALNPATLGQSKIDCVILRSKNSISSERTEIRNRTLAEQQYRITVKAYMTRKSSPDFDFMKQWNNDIPMPLRTMVGTKERETAGMVYMKLHGDITAPIMYFCMKCGKPITNPISQYFGMGPECGGHNYVNPFNSEAELKEAVEKYRREYLQKITWSGWIIKSAITQEEEIC